MSWFPRRRHRIPHPANGGAHVDRVPRPTTCWLRSQALIASGSKDTCAKLWDAHTGSAIATLHGHKGMIQATSWHANGHWLLTAGKDNACKVQFQRAGRCQAAALAASA